MRATQFDFKSLLPHVVQAYTEVFGEEYYELISNKMNKFIMIPYDDIGGLESYIDFRKTKKKEELIVKLLQEGGIISSNYDNFFNPLEDETYDVIDTLFCDIDMCFNLENDDKLPLRAFKDYDGSIDDKLAIINYFRNYQEPEITEENLKEFSKTQEYNKLLLLMDKMNKVYDILLKEYVEFEKQFEADIDFIANERKRENEVHQGAKKQMWPLLLPFIPAPIKDKIKDKTFEEQNKIVLGEQKLDEAFLIEYFSHENINKLESPNTPIHLKICIIRNQITFLRRIGCKIPNIDLSYNNIKSNIGRYLEFLNHDYIRQFIVPNEIIDYIKKLRKRKNEESTKNFTMGREDVKSIRNIKRLFNNEQIIGSLANFVNSKIVGVTGIHLIIFTPILIYTIRNDEGGNLSFLLIHELGHIIEKNINNSGFDVTNNLNSDNNPYDDSYRKYERFNETINDIFTIEALKTLHKKDIYLIEPKEITDLSYNFGNTSFITQSLLKPLIVKFRKQVIKAKLFAQPQILTEYIGENNFEHLVDVINKVDFLTENGLTKEKIKKSPQDSIVIEYNKQIERLKTIYQRIDEYYTNYCISLKENKEKSNSKKDD